MYSGIIYEIGEVLDISETSLGLKLKIKSPLFTSKKIGNSFAVDGVCLTQVDCQGLVSTFDVSQETLSKTTIGNYSVGEKVHLETPLTAGDELGGHFVQGHVDATATLVEISPDRLVIELPDGCIGHAIVKGSIAIDGVSLTIANIDDRCIESALITHTYEKTLFKEKKKGSKVNIEMDMFAKMIYKYLDQMDLKKAFS